jgi:hypothetical protein
MHGSKENHAGYIYRRKNAESDVETKTGKVVEQQQQSLDIPCDPFYKDALEKIRRGLSTLKEDVLLQVNANWESSPSTRSGRRQRNLR